MQKKKENLKNGEEKGKGGNMFTKGKRKHNQRGGINPLCSGYNRRESKRRSRRETECLKEGCALQENREGKEAEEE